MQLVIEVIRGDILQRFDVVNTHTLGPACELSC